MTNDGFEIARSNRTWLLSVVRFGQPRRPFEGHKLSWLDMNVGAVSSDVTAAAAAGALKIAVKEGAKFRKGMTLSVKGSNEILLVTGVSHNELDIKRGFGGTTAAAIAT